jgi:hypothetical protein
MKRRLIAFIAMMLVIALAAIGVAYATGGSEPNLVVKTPTALTSVGANTLTEPSSTSASGKGEGEYTQRTF